MKLDELLLRDRKQFHKEAKEEWSQLKNDEKLYVNYLLSTNHKYDNPNNSHLLYALGITNQIPIGYIKRTGASLCDIDCDFQDNRRDEVIDYIKEKYGSDHVAGIATYGSLKCRGAIKAVARTLGVDYSIGDQLAKLTPPPVNGVPPTLNKCYEDVPKLAAWHDDPTSIEGSVLNWSDRIENRIDHSGAHASGIIIADRPLYEIAPIAQDRRGNIVTQWDMNEIEKVGLVKFDFLGLTILTVISEALSLIKGRTGKTIDLSKIPLDDSKVFTNLQNGDTAGLFQIETSSGIKELMVKMKPKDIEDLGLLVALYRPGPLSSDYLDTWLRIRAGEDEPEYLIPELKPILQATDGWLVYQESCMQIAIAISGYTPAEADELRKVIGKKLPEEMKKHKDKFLQGAKNNGHSREVAEKLFQDIETFAGYGFNKSHAIAYGYLMYQTAWLKTHYPVEYMCAALTCNYNDIDQVIKYIFDCKNIGINILPPDINTSNTAFTIDEQNNIRFGLAAIKNLGADIVDSIILTRGTNKFKNIIDFISRVDIGKVNKRKLDSLVLGGALDSSGDTRASMLDTIEQAIEYKKLLKSFESKLETYNKKLEAYNTRNEEIKLADIAGLKHKMRPLKMPIKPEAPKQPNIKRLPELPEKELLSQEKELLGFYISGHPITKYKQLIAADSDLITIEDIKASAENENLISLIAIPNSVTERTAKASGKKMASMILEDCTGSITATAFAKTWENYQIYLEAKEPMRFKCRVNLQEKNDAIVSPELIILDIRTLKSITISDTLLDTTFPLEITKIGQLAKLLNKYSGEEKKIRLTFIGENDTIVRCTKTFGIKDSGSFLKELYKI